ncbi:MAG: hypothetical protein MJ159_02180 [Treponemataceae bacterium]|nr:hypothetical protein [Treponemataceae bacterium]
MKKIKLAAFTETSAEMLVKEMNFQKIFLPSDKTEDTRILLSELSDAGFVICFGQKPLIKNKLCVELLAKEKGEILTTDFETETLLDEFKKNELKAMKSSSPGNSFCNAVYWNALKYIKQNKLNCKILFIHIPFEKNIDDMAVFRSKVLASINGFLQLAWQT